MYVCVCYAVTEDDVHAEIADGASTEDDVAERCGAGTGCGSCVERIGRMLAGSGPLVGCRGRMPLAG